MSYKKLLSLKNSFQKSIPDNKMYLYQVVHVVMDAYVIHLSAASRRVAIER